jgi:hypothetical protein
MSKLENVLHNIVNLLPWRQESDQLDAHAIIAEEIPALLGRNATPAGVQEPSEHVEKTDTSSDASTDTPATVNPWETKEN